MTVHIPSYSFASSASVRSHQSPRNFPSVSNAVNAMQVDLGFERLRTTGDYWRDTESEGSGDQQVWVWQGRYKGQIVMVEGRGCDEQEAANDMFANALHLEDRAIAYTSVLKHG